MTGDLLSQDEVESLLSAMDHGGPKKGPAAASPSRVHSPPKTRAKVTPYDFKRPERVGKEQMRALQTLHEGFGRNFAAKLSAFLRSMVEVKLTSVDQLTYSEFVFSLENPTCFNILSAEPLEGNLILDINPAVLYPIIGRLLGGGSDVGTAGRRPLTEIELRLVGRISNLFLDELRDAWENVVDLKLKVERVESNPQLAQIVPPNEVVVLISFELTIQEIRGMINLCIPYNTIERIGNKILANNWAAPGGRHANEETVAKMTHNLQGALVNVLVELARTSIRTVDLIGLRVGDVITTDVGKDDPLMVLCEGVPKFQARPGSYKGRAAVVIEGPVAHQTGPRKIPA